MAHFCSFLHDNFINRYRRGTKEDDYLDFKITWQVYKAPHFGHFRLATIVTAEGKKYDIRSEDYDEHECQPIFETNVKELLKDFPSALKSAAY